MARARRGYSAQERHELWERWKRGESISEIGRAIPTDSIASWWFCVALTCQPSSYFDQ